MGGTGTIRARTEMFARPGYEKRFNRACSQQRGEQAWGSGGL